MFHIITTKVLVELWPILSDVDERFEILPGAFFLLSSAGNGQALLTIV